MNESCNIRHWFRDNLQQASTLNRPGWVNTTQPIVLNDQSQFLVLIGKAGVHNFINLAVKDKAGTVKPLVELGKMADNGYQFGDESFQMLCNAFVSKTGACVRNENRLLRQACDSKRRVKISYKAFHITSQQYQGFLQLIGQINREQAGYHRKLEQLKVRHAYFPHLFKQSYITSHYRADMLFETLNQLFLEDEKASGEVFTREQASTLFELEQCVIGTIRELLIRRHFQEEELSNQLEQFKTAWQKHRRQVWLLYCFVLNEIKGEASLSAYQPSDHDENILVFKPVRETTSNDPACTRLVKRSQYLNLFNNNCRHTSIEMLDHILEGLYLSGNKDAVRWHECFWDFACKTTMEAGTYSDPLYILPLPPNSFTFEIDQQAKQQILHILYQRLEGILRRCNGHPNTWDKFHALKTLYLELVGNQQPKLNFLEAIVTHYLEEKNRQLLYHHHRGWHFPLFQMTKTARMFEHFMVQKNQEMGALCMDSETPVCC